MRKTTKHATDSRLCDLLGLHVPEMKKEVSELLLAVELAHVARFFPRLILLCHPFQQECQFIRSCRVVGKRHILEHLAELLRCLHCVPRTLIGCNAITKSAPRFRLA